MTIITRFAPSPTGYLHIGGARTALFNYLLAKHYNGKFLLRIEDTDKNRSNQKAIDAIFKGLQWLRIDWDESPIFQSERTHIYQQIAQKLVQNGKAYYCFTSQEEINALRQNAVDNKQSFIFQSKWRDADPSTYPKNVKPVIRLKTSNQGETAFHDQVQGNIIVQNTNIDDVIITRADGSATYMFAVVVDDHDMNITHIIRGDDHLTNTTKQILIYQACNWEIPTMSHIPLIHSVDGTKLSKRHGALGIEEYEKMGYLPEALCNYLLRLGWSHGNDEIISSKQAIKWFCIKNIGRSPAKLDFSKMQYLNAYYLKEMDEERLVSIIHDNLSKTYTLDNNFTLYLKQGMSSLKTRVSTLNELIELAKIYITNYDIQYQPKALDFFINYDKSYLKQSIDMIVQIQDFSKDIIQNTLKTVANNNNIKISELMQPIRVLITGYTASPSVFEIMTIIGKENTLKRLNANIDKFLHNI